jgi:hypothetical protein
MEREVGGEGESKDERYAGALSGFSNRGEQEEISERGGRPGNASYNCEWIEEKAIGY